MSDSAGEILFTEQGQQSKRTPHVSYSRDASGGELNVESSPFISNTSSENEKDDTNGDMAYCQESTSIAATSYSTLASNPIHDFKNAAVLGGPAEEESDCTTALQASGEHVTYSAHLDDIINAQTEGLAIVSDFCFDMSTTVVGKRIRKKAGNTFKKECKDLVKARESQGLRPPFKLYDVVHTCAGGELSPNIKYIIHTFLSLFKPKGALLYQYSLSDVYRSIFVYASKLKIASLTLPILGTGNVGVPLDVSIQAFLDGYKAFKRSLGPNSLVDIRIVHNKPETIRKVLTLFESHANTDSCMAPAVRKTSYSSHYGLRKAPLPERCVEICDKLKIFFLTGDITSLKCDAIVLPTNKDLEHISGLADAVKEKAGVVFERDCAKIRTNRGALKSSDIVHVRAGNLSPAIKNIILTVMGKYDTCALSDEQRFQLILMYARILEYTHSFIGTPVKSLGMTLIGTGKADLPDTICLAAFSKSVQTFVNKYDGEMILEEINIINPDDDMTNKCFQLFSLFKEVKNTDVLGLGLDRIDKDLAKTF